MEEGRKAPRRLSSPAVALLIPEQVARLFQDNVAHPFRLIVARHSD